MSDTVQLAVVTGIVAIATLIIKAIIDSHAKKQEKKMESVEIKIDGRLTELLELTRVSERAKGKIEGKAEEKEIQKVEIIQAPTATPLGNADLKITGGEIKITTETKKKK